MWGRCWHDRDRPTISGTICRSRQTASPDDCGRRSTQHHSPSPVANTRLAGAGHRHRHTHRVGGKQLCEQLSYLLRHSTWKALKTQRCVPADATLSDRGLLCGEASKQTVCDDTTHQEQCDNTKHKEQSGSSSSHQQETQSRQAGRLKPK